MAEEWKILEGTDGKYSVSSLGRIYSNKRRNLLSPVFNVHYFKVSITKNGICKSWSLHRLIAETFIPNIDNKPFINHKNGIKTDNRVDNLEWCTSGENNLHAFRILNRRNDTQSTPVSQYDLDGVLIKSYWSIMDAAKQTGFYASGISVALDKDDRSCHGFRWKQTA